MARTANVLQRVAGTTPYADVFVLPPVPAGLEPLVPSPYGGKRGVVGPRPPTQELDALGAERVAVGAHAGHACGTRRCGVGA